MSMGPITLPPVHTGLQALQPWSTLEAQLGSGDAAVVAAARAQALAQLDALERRLQAQLQQGLSRADYTRLSTLLDACQAAREVLTMHAVKKSSTGSLSGGIDHVP